MKTRDLAREIARQHKLPEAAAAENIDLVVHDIFQKLQRGRPVRLPGLGILSRIQTKSNKARKGGSR